MCQHMCSLQNRHKDPVPLQVLAVLRELQQGAWLHQLLLPAALVAVGAISAVAASVAR
jgi:hypothetical protein